MKVYSKKWEKVGNRIINPPHKVSVHKMYWVSQLILEPWCVVMLNERFINTCGMVDLSIHVEW